MASQTIESLIPGGKATAAPPLGPALGPLGVNIGQVNPGKNIEINLQIVKQAQIVNGTYCLDLPSGFYPNYAEHY